MNCLYSNYKSLKYISMLYIEGNYKLTHTIKREIENLREALWENRLYDLEPILRSIEKKGFGIKLDEDIKSIFADSGLDHLIESSEISMQNLYSNLKIKKTILGDISQPKTSSKILSAQFSNIVELAFGNILTLDYTEPHPCTLAIIEEVRLDRQGYFNEGERRMVNFQIQTNETNSKTLATLILEKPRYNSESAISYSFELILESFKDSQNHSLNYFIFDDSKLIKTVAELSFSEASELSEYAEENSHYYAPTPKKLKISECPKVYKAKSLDSEETSFLSTYCSRSDSYIASRYITERGNQTINNEGLARRIDFISEITEEVESLYNEPASPISDSDISHSFPSPVSDISTCLNFYETLGAIAETTVE